jgi:hypothetical protein
MSASTQPLSHDDDYARVLDSALDVIRGHLLQHRPLDVVDYICQFQSQIKSEINAATPASPATAAATVGAARSPSRASAPPNGGKFDTFVMPSGNIEDFHKGLSSRIGFPHLQFFKTMEAEHCIMAGCDMQFTTRNYGISTTARAEWCVVVRGQTPPPEHMEHDRVTVTIDDKLNSSQARKAGLRMEEVVAVVLYTGPMYATLFTQCDFVIF